MRRTLTTLLFFVLTLQLSFTQSMDSISAEKLASWQAATQWDQVDETATADIRKFTTDVRYCTPLVSYIPEHESVPSPRDFLGHIAGAEDYLTGTKDEYRYLEALAAASPRVMIEELGLSEGGRRMIMLVIADEATLQNLNVFKRYTAQLADPRKIDEKAAMQICKQAKPIMTINAGLHSTETGPPEMVMELAYRLAVSEHPDIQEIRQNVITNIIPVMEPDGRDRIVDWYYRVLKNYDNLDYIPDRSPPYWGSHAYHDNNRDGIQMTLELTKAYNRMFHEWHPQYGLDLHESVPLLYVSSGTGPYNEMVDPIAINEWQWISNWEITELSKQGMPGVWTWGFYTGWNPGYLVWTAINHNSLGRFYETFGNSVPKTMERDLSRANYAGKPVTSRQWYRAAPPEAKVTWSMRNNTNYMQSGVLASLSLMARNRNTMLFNFWKKGFNSWQKGLKEAPYAWVIPADQAGRDRTAYLINQLQRHAIEVHRATEEFSIGEDTFQAGDFVVRLDQPYGNFARNLLSISKFPKDAEHRPYDDVSWTLGKTYRVDTRPIDDPAILKLKSLEMLDQPVQLEGKHTGKGKKNYIIAHEGANSLIGLRYALKDFQVLAADSAFQAEGIDFPAGSMIVPTQKGLKDVLDKAAGKAMVSVHATSQTLDIATHELDLPRLALYHNWTYTQPDGWVRYTLKEAGIEFDYINDDDLRKNDLKSNYDVILMAHQGGGDVKSMIHGRNPQFGPQSYTQTEEFASHGVIDQSEDITGGMGFKGLMNLEEFLSEDGVLILLGSAGKLATDLGLVRNVSSSSAVNTPGSTVQTLVVQPNHPIAYGFNQVNHIFRTNAPLYTVPEKYEHWIVVQYGTKLSEKQKEKIELPKGSQGEFLITGYVSGEQEMQRKAVVLDVSRRKGGRVILYSFNPLHRHLNHGDHNYVFNAILHWNDFPSPKPEKHPDLALD